MQLQSNSYFLNLYKKLVEAKKEIFIPVIIVGALAIFLGFYSLTLTIYFFTLYLDPSNPDQQLLVKLVIIMFSSLILLPVGILLMLYQFYPTNRDFINKLFRAVKNFSILAVVAWTSFLLVMPLFGRFT